MKREANKMLKQAGMVYLSQAMIDLAESLNPTRSSDKKKVSKMIKDLEDIRNHECKQSDNAADKL